MKKEVNELKTNTQGYPAVSTPASTASLSEEEVINEITNNLIVYILSVANENRAKMDDVRRFVELLPSNSIVDKIVIAYAKVGV